ncbi:MULTISPECIES: flavin-containing monooxygenase [Pseudonocardia]|uniref:4-hydroxyacetophenone monooxygenase n=2 Tax=Pseudonocardia TaxID=1847 RepID=A0A1Y2MWP2_PSEAH|nr:MULTISPECIES: NAD(P)/FAD-dependent oxidoreductase [Pseudonocardia]OSY39247.1 4-hydroxyacetophenone monooxygenase [Pseudonocardia autotrophica]TDN76531.1 cation diffusion facilitator CzcD-associated flavoprotein CzcO [Pseudonocardia autotrophica]BBG00531.1 4-hydroxyacetophenone monooxygenase [Pseudonocardia autotrophica]GEC26491.1 4-hydroxyacetophenone monooxygenase [Pseudonocardia saturnea]
MSGQQIDTLIVGSGFAGLGAAVRLDEAGRRDWLMLEKADTLGGTWRDNTYPGCACDVESHLYSFSFFPNDDWTRTFARQAEIRSYLEDVADHYRLRGRIRFGAHVTGAEWDGRCWDVRLADGSVLRARYVIFGTGALHEPAVPEIDGLDRFAGTAFHSARWPRGADLRGKRVAVIGTGASAIQFVPAVAPVAEHLTLFQRTAPWVLPKPDKPIRDRTRRAFRRVPGLRAGYRAALYWRHEAMVLGFLHPRVMRIAERVARLYLRRVFAGDPELRRAVTPDFTMGCKRVLMSNDYYPALRRDDVAVETAGIERITEHGVVTTDGVLHEVDTIVFGTGFRVGEGLERMAITGRDGVKLSEVWRDGAQAFHGTTIAGFPNLFTVVGPNTGLGHSSMVLMIESQLNYVLDAMALVDRNRAVAIDTRADVQDEHNAELQRRLGAAVWGSGGCASWYLDRHGRNRTLWPGSTFAFRNRTRRVDPAAHELVA